MKTFSGDTDVVHQNDLKPYVRAYFSATAVRVREEVWLRVETRWVGDGAPLKVSIFRQDEEPGSELVKEMSGRVSGDLWEQQWRVELPQSRLDELHGPIHLWFEVTLAGRPEPARSQMLLVHRTRFSS